MTCEVTFVNTTDQVLIYSGCELKTGEAISRATELIAPQQLCLYHGSEGTEAYIDDSYLCLLHTLQFTRPGEPHVVVASSSDHLHCSDHLPFTSSWIQLA